jgi:hypothetical protein
VAAAALGAASATGGTQGSPKRCKKA